jgi:hypothetical protein
VTLSHQEASGSGETDYPPKLTGMRGSHDGSFEIAHGMRYGATWEEAAATGEHYDLVVVGGRLSGLAAAYYFRKALPDASVLSQDPVARQATLSPRPARVSRPQLPDQN